jgi:hypothetical protein
VNDDTPRPKGGDPDYVKRPETPELCLYHLGAVYYFPFISLRSHT